MPFELIMLLGFFGTVLLSLLPAAAEKVDKKSFRKRNLLRRSDGGSRGAARHGRVTMYGEAIRRRHAGSAAA